MFRVRHACAVLLVGAAVLGASVARAQSQVDFATCRNAYVTKDYREAEARFASLAKVLESAPKHTPQLLDVWMYLGAAKLGRALRVDSVDPIENGERQTLKADAAKLFEKVILEDPQYAPDATSFPTYVLDAYGDVKRSLADKLNQIAIAAAKEKARQEQIARDLKDQQDAYVKLLEKQASSESVVDHHSRWIALVPFGVGQFQNGKPALGAVFLGLEAACIIGTGVTFAMYRLDISRGAEAIADQTLTRRDALLRYQAYTDRAEVIRIVNLTFAAAAGLAMAIGILEAQIGFVGDTSAIRARPLPQKPPLPQRSAFVVAPTIAPLFGERSDGTLSVGAQIGVVGRF